MPELEVDAITTSDMENKVTDTEIEPWTLDGISDLKETEYINSDFGVQMGIYRTIPEFKIALDMRAIWTVGEEITTGNSRDKVIIDNIIAWGKGTFREVLKNMIVVKRLGQDSYAEIMRNDEGDVINLKPLNAGNIRQVYNRQGLLLRYEKINNAKDKTAVEQVFQPEELFHLTNKRIGDEIHGVSDSQALNSIIEASKESFDDVRKLMHRYVKPMMKFILDTDDDSKIDAAVAKFDDAVEKGENLYIPKGTVEQELIAVPSNSTLNALPWREHLRNYFFQVVGIPQIILGSSGEFTESTAKIAYLAFEQSVKDEQTDTMEQIWDQLGLRVKLTFPASLQNELLSDTAKDSTSGAAQPQDTTAGVGA